MYRYILVAYDGSAGAKRALIDAVDLAADWHGALGVLWVAEDVPHHAATVGEVNEEAATQERHFGRLQVEAIALGRERRVQVRAELRRGQPARVVTDFAADEGYDLLVIGRGGHAERGGRSIGCTADAISRRAPCAVLLVP